jgi:hypothetical protein
LLKIEKIWHDFFSQDGVRMMQNLSVGCTLNKNINPLNAELNPICHLLALLGARRILHVSKIRVNIFKIFVILKSILQIFWNTYLPIAVAKFVEIFWNTYLPIAVVKFIEMYVCA